ncbi:hypothetical protein AIOL_003587 [Candidatus Rhodobacter oscarellae]|uniref:Uncharacterized protein n=2 Tax=Candidatus Rhodobacter oscarellae TaxID=1675527 RepID=A0A0J9EAE3_9RHOB|nr:hypothetical protein AIOL_003587 [Candidatus Rhodobacter lobularis]
MALVMRFTDAAPAAVVILPSKPFIAAMPEGIAILSQNRLTLTLRDDGPDLAARLYASGAWLVLPAGLTGCLPLPKTLRQSG